MIESNRILLRQKNHKRFRERDNWSEINYLMFAQALLIFTLSAEKRVRCFVFMLLFARNYNARRAEMPA